jgi:single-stranded DNA-binding protein
MNGFVYCRILGTLAEPLTKRETKNGKLWVKGLIEVRGYRRSADGAAGQEETTAITVNLFGKTAQVALDFLKVGDPVCFQLRVAGTEFKSNDGAIRRGVTLTVDTMHLLPNDRRSEGR